MYVVFWAFYEGISSPSAATDYGYRYNFGRFYEKITPLSGATTGYVYCINFLKNKKTPTLF